MMDLSEEILARLHSQSIHSLRQAGRVVGVAEPTKKKKDELIRDIMAIARGQAEPAARSTRGAPVKSEEYDKELVADILKCRRQSRELSGEEQGAADGQLLEVRSDSPESGEKLYSGILEMNERRYFVRVGNYRCAPTAEDVFIHQSFINKFGLREGDKIVCKAQIYKAYDNPTLTYVLSVNGKAPDEPREELFDRQESIYPDVQIKLGGDGASLTQKIIDMFTPLAFGQRVLVGGAANTGKTSVICDILGGVKRNYPQAKPITLLIGARPEDVMYVKNSVGGEDVFYSTFENSDYQHVHTATLVSEYAKRQAEGGDDVILAIDGFSRLVCAYASALGEQLGANGLPTKVFEQPKNILYSAKRVKGGGSLTIVATVNTDKNSAVDSAVYSELKNTVNTRILLDEELADMRLYPAIDVRRSGTKQEEILLDGKSLAVGYEARRALVKWLTKEDLYGILYECGGADEILSRIKKLEKDN